MEHYFTNNDNLPSRLKEIEFKYNDKVLRFTSDLGVFSKDKIDYGSRLLIDTYCRLGRKNCRILDVGCGYGVIGISLALFADCDATLIDINRRAVHLAKMNISALKVHAKAFQSDLYTMVDEKYDCIVTNPPIRAGKKTVYAILDGAMEYLNNRGELWFVMRKDQGAKSAIEHLRERMGVEILEKSKGFYIIVAKVVDKEVNSC